ncbi:hypothetical protein AUK18_01125 [Candidatus Beckwithbacteria bacterium CG2_30_44_31]|uniref:Acetyltransferase n=1 Tax=Candidatus Beckwithbacteria bacterium CG2_30_44_31 TaxID=1805035 RepID=A0A1J5BAI5_9BACT|nr:MAG: hypothetical protein AUK18_01125 [Candidatus Beckwithbacteria bacterium CG2_30_44_31]
MNKAIKEVGLSRILKYFIFGLWQWVFDLLPYSPLRVWWLRFGDARIGENCVIDKIYFMNLDRTGLSGLILGKDCYLGPLVLLDLAGKITLENQVTIAAKSTILSHHSVGFSDHPLIKFYPKKTFQTTLKSGCVLGVASIILPGITIGKNSLVAAASMVNKDVPDQVMVAGIPALFKKKLA